MKISTKDKMILRDAAKEYMQVAKSDTMAEIIDAWYAHSRLERKRPMVLFEDGPLKSEYVDELLCEGEFARSIELDLKRHVWHFNNAKDDHPLMPYYAIKWQIPFLHFGGIEIKEKRATDAYGRHVAHMPEHPIKNLGTDLDLLKPLDFFVDKEKTNEIKDTLNDAFGDILPTVIRGKNVWTMGLTVELIKLISLEDFYMAMYDHPEELHKIMEFLMNEKLRLVKHMEEGDMLTLNNEADYYATGSYGFTEELPQKDFTGHVRTQDLSVLLESQETSTVSPALYEEFVFPYYMEIAKQYGRLYYGCCEPVEKIWHLIKRYPNLAAVSISPWCDQEAMADNIAGDYIYSRKPMPTLVSTEHFDEDAIKNDLEFTVKTAAKCELELIMKDVHSVNFEYNRIGRWVELARDAVEKYYG